MNTPDFSSITLAKAIPAPAHQGNPNHNLTNGQFAAAPAYSTQISNLEEANAYWEKHFVDKGRHHHIECRFGTKSYRFTVKFARNHSFTKNTNGKHGVKYDHLREFDIDRAKAMDAIWQVLRNPSVVNWSETDPRNKQFDKQLDFVSVRFGRVILSPTPTKDDIKAGKVSAFEFVSWHEPTRQQFSAAQKRMSNVRVTPTQMKKAHSDEQAFLLSRTSINLPKGSRAEVLPVSEGFPLDWTSCFQGSHSRNSFESDSLTGSGGIMVEPEQICKSIPTPAQAEAGNYAKRKMAWHSLTISIENEPGSIRCGIDPNGKAWKTKMIVPYGYINGSIGMDSDQIDIFFGSNSDADVVYLVNQLIPPSFAKVDEQKCMLNFSSEAAARAAYLKHYDDPRFLGPITAMPVAEFVEKARKANGRMVKSHIPTYTKRDGTVVPAHDDKRMAAKPHSQSSMIFREDTGGDQVVVFPYASGMSARRDMSATIESSAGLGTEVSQLSKNGMSMIADAIADGKPVFVDSGAFNAFKRSIREGGNAAGVNFDKVFDKYDELSEKVREKSRNHDLLMLVAPDVVGDQMATLSLIVKHADRICNWIDAGHEVIIPFQRGKMGQYDMFLNVKMVLNDRPFVVGIPSAAAALGNEDLNELLSHPYKPDRIHILGAISSRRMMERMAVIRDAYEDDVPGVTADAMVMRSKLHEIGGMTGEVKFDKIKEILNRVVPAMWGGAMPDLQKSILIEFDNGNEYLLGDGQFSFGDDELRKAEALGAGQRWITVHPNGKDGKGVPVMVQETQHGSGVFHVIGGAGGKLNYLKLRGLKPESSYKEHAAEKAKARRTGQKVQRARDKELGLDKAKGKAREEVKSLKVQADKSFIQKVAEKMGWKPTDLEPNIPENVSDATQKKLAQQHHGELLKRANAAVELQHQNLLTDAMAREEAGGVSVEPDEHTPPDQLDISDLDDSRPQEKAGLGFAAHYAERAAENGADESVVKQEADAKKETRQAQMTDGQRAAIKTRGDVAQQVKSEIAAIREPVTTNVKAVLADAKDAVELIKAQKEWKATQKAASAANKDIDTATEVKAYNLEVSAVDDADIANELENDLRTIRTKAFLSAVGKDVPDPEKQLRQHISAGAFNSINALAVTAGGNALVDRSVVDVLGVEGAAQVLARRLHADLPADEMSKLTDGMEAFHLHHYMETSKDALQEAKDLHDAAAEIKLGDASHGGDFEAARELLHRRNEAVEHAHKILGTALGEMEANAALVTALKGGRSDKSMEVPLGKVSDEDAIRQVRAIGLQRGDYAIERVAGNQVLTITPEGLDRLAKPVDREELERTRNTLDILNGGQDEDDWLPQGFAKRPDLAMDLKPGVAETLAKPFKPSGDMQQSLKDYIGGRAADGDSPADIVADIQSSDFFQKSGNEGAYREALEAVAPLKGEDGKMARAESLTDSFNEYADSLVKREYGGKISTLQRQNFEPDHVAQDALHRALADHPEGISAYKPIGELTNDDQQALRKFFYANVAHESPEAASLRERLDSMAHTEPEKESEDMFGEVSVNPEWQDWKSQRDTLAEEVGSASLNWSKYTDAMGGHTSAYATMQDMIRSKVGKSFNENYNKLNPSAPLKMGRQVVRGNLNHLDAVDPKARAAREAKERELVDGLRERSQGKYASGSVSDKLDAAREQEEAFNQSQMGFFSTEQDDMFGGGASDAPKVEKPLGADERYTLGHAAERTIASMMGTVGQNFKPGQPLKIFSPTMSGPDGVMRQRAIKIIAQNKRVILSASAGSGKTAMFLGSFSHLQSQGKVKKGVVICPSIVQGQVGAEALRFMEPGKYKWHCDPGCSFEDRLAAYKDPETHFSVVTHQSFRDDILKMAAMKSGEEPGAIADRMDGMTRKERADFTKAVLDHHGINFDFSAIDEGHGLLDRVGKDNSRMSNVIGGVTDNTGYTVSATADPVKNDISEAFSHLEKMDSARYNDRDAFMRRYGVDTQGSKDALKRELIRHVLPFKIEPKVRADKKEIQVEPSEVQTKALAELDKNIGKVRMARMEGKTDIEAMKSISPGQFKNAPESEHEAIAKELAGSLGIIKGSAVRAILDSSPDSAKIDALAKIATDRKGKPGVVFAHSLEAVENIKARLEKDGHRVMTLTGADSSEDKAAKIRGFNPEKGDRTHDIIVCSDAGSTGANLQSGSWLTQFDTSQTAMVHAQRNARIHRIGQKQDIELMDLVANHPSERKARERLKTKYELRELMSSSMESLDDTGLAYFLHQRKVAQQQESMF